MCAFLNQALDLEDVGESTQLWRDDMELGLLGKKIGMTQLNDADHGRVPVTAIEVGPCLVMQKKTMERDGYTAIKLAFGTKTVKSCDKPTRIQFEKIKSAPRQFVREFRVPAEKLGEYEVGQEISLNSVFWDGQMVDVCGLTKGRGFSGVFKRWGMRGGSRTHGTHEAFRHGGSIGNNSWPGHVYKNKKMAGRLGNQRTTTQNLRVVKTLPEKNCILVEGCVPGANQGYLEIRPSVTKRMKNAQNAPKKEAAA